MKAILRQLAIGYAVLTTAIALNALALVVDITTWYGLFEDPSVGPIDALFLFALYPLALGAAGFWAHRLLPGKAS